MACSRLGDRLSISGKPAWNMKPYAKLSGLVVVAFVAALILAELAIRMFHLAPELGVVQKGRYRLPGLNEFA